VSHFDKQGMQWLKRKADKLYAARAARILAAIESEPASHSQATNFPRPHISQPVGEGREAGLPGGDQGGHSGPSDRPLRVLVACEFSGVVRRAFRALGHEAWSCDLLPAEDGSQWHYQRYVEDVLAQGLAWDLMIAHPPCTYLCNSGVRWLAPGGRLDGERHKAMQAACDLFAALYHAPVARVAIENPVMHGCAREYLAGLGVPAFTQSIQPWQFGHGEVKRTCLWLRGLEPLRPTAIVDGRTARVHRASPGKDRWKERSRTLDGVAAAFAAQWGGLVAPRCRSCGGDLGIDALGSGLCASCRRDRLDEGRFDW
jgi:hypothetical protein